MVDRRDLKFIFVGGKGGVGKTTTSSSIAIQLAKRNRKTLLISTDPAHNLSDSFGQKFSGEMTQVQGVQGLFAIETDEKEITETLQKEFQIENDQSVDTFKKFFKAIPGINEFMVFRQLLQLRKEKNIDVVVFDTAPTGHTLQLFSFPSALKTALSKLKTMKDKIDRVMNIFSGDGGNMLDKIFKKQEQLQQDI